MDAKITKSRLGNMLAYDWLKIIVVILVAVLGLSVFFTTVRTRPKMYQRFTIYAYEDVRTGSDFSGFAENLTSRGALSYDVLNITTESFYGNSMASTAFAARRAAGEGTVMFITDERIYETDENGDLVLEEGEPVVEEESKLYAFAAGGAAQERAPAEAIVFDTEYYLLTLCREYLENFYGDRWQDETATADEAVVREAFLARNGSDRRYRSAASREEGVRDEMERIQELRSDYLFVLKKFEDGTYTHTKYTFERNGETVTQSLGVNVGNLADLNRLVYDVTEDGTVKKDRINLVFLYSDYASGTAEIGNGNDLRFEGISFLRALVELYGSPEQREG